MKQSQLELAREILPAVVATYPGNEYQIAYKAMEIARVFLEVTNKEDE